MDKTIYDFSATTIEGKEISFSEYRGKALLIVNTASKCGFTPQLKGLQALHDRYKDRGLAVLGFPCNQFASQEPGKDSEIASFCSRNYGVSFQLFSRIDVNGQESHPLYVWLKSQTRRFFSSGRITWNFTKFLVDRGGKVVSRFSPATAPEAIAEAIDRALEL